MAITNLKYHDNESYIEINESKFDVYAHDNELFQDHFIKTLKVFEELIDDKVLFKFYKYLSDNKYIDLNFDEFVEVVKQSVIFHDFGKLSFNFQINKLNNSKSIKDNQKSILNKYGLLDLVNEFESKHSFISALSFILNYNSKIKNQELLGLILSYVIIGHHTNIKDVKYQDDLFYKPFTKSQKLTLSIIITLMVKNFNSKNLKYFQKFANEGSLFLENKVSDWDGSVSFFYMYIYSLLIVSDIFATTKYDIELSEFNNNFNIFNFNNRISIGLKDIMNEYFFKKDYNKNLDNLSYKSKNLENIININDLRKEMLLESSNTLLNTYYYNKIFFLNMPTGGGKTNTSMKLALDLINNTSADRIIYAMPFINIIEQNYDVICESFGLSEEKGQIRKIYSGSESIFPNKSNEFKSNILLNDDFFNYPVICTTFVSLFNSVIKNNKKSKYRLAALANSVIILDEIQSLPLKNWTSLYYIINELANNYNIYFIIMSATLPEFNRLELNFKGFKYSNISLINNPSKYFDHKLFNRTQIKNEIKSFSLINKQDEDNDYLHTLLQNNKECINYLLSLIEENFNQDYNKGLMVFNTIKSSKIIFECLSHYANEYGYEIDLLNSSLMPSTKKEIISKINNIGKEEYVDKKCILISTQSVEAGVDVSFDFVVRDFAVIDSIEQVRGRCNRSGELNERFKDSGKKGNVYLIKLSDSNNYYYEYIYDDEEQKTRIFCTDNLLKNTSLKYSYSDIKDYYENISNIINNMNDDKKENFVFNDRDNIIRLNKAEYSKLLDDKGIHIIKNDQEQFSIFICNDLNVMSSSLETEFNEKYDCSIFDLKSDDLKEFYNKKNNKNDFIFSFNEINFIKKQGKLLYENNKILAKPLLEYYKSLFKDNNKNFNYFKLIKKEFASILYKFIINVSVAKYKDIYHELKNLDKFGFFYILPQEKIGEDEYTFYSLKRGFNYNPTICEIM